MFNDTTQRAPCLQSKSKTPLLAERRILKRQQINNKLDVITKVVKVMMSKTRLVLIPFKLFSFFLKWYFCGSDSERSNRVTSFFGLQKKARDFKVARLVLFKLTGAESTPKSRWTKSKQVIDQFTTQPCKWAKKTGIRSNPCLFNYYWIKISKTATSPLRWVVLQQIGFEILTCLGTSPAHDLHSEH